MHFSTPRDASASIPGKERGEDHPRPFLALLFHCSVGRLRPTEEVRFELTGPSRAHRFSRPAHSTTLPLLQDAVFSPGKPWIPLAFPDCRNAILQHPISLRQTAPNFAEFLRLVKSLATSDPALPLVQGQ